MTEEDPRSAPRLVRHDSEPGERTPLPHPRDLVAATALLTGLSVGRPSEGSSAFARATVFFPLVGLGIGAGLAGLNWLIGSHLTPYTAAILLGASWQGFSPPVTLHAGRKRVGHARARWRALALAAGFAAAKSACLWLLAGERPAALLFAPMLARWSMVVLAIGARDARAPGQKFNAAITFREFALTSIFSCAAVFTMAEAAGILTVVCVAAVSLTGRLLTHRWANGVTWPILSISAQLIEILVLLLWALV